MLKTGISVLALAFGLAGCASQTFPPSRTKEVQESAPTANAGGYGPVRTVKSRDGKFEGELLGTVVQGGKFSKLQIGMPMNEVLGLIGGPDGTDSHETGKRWIPFYFGGDARRIEVLYKGEGCLTYTGGNPWGGGENQLIRITATQRLDCME